MKQSSLYILSILLFAACSKQPLKQYTGEAYAQFGPIPSRMNNAVYEFQDTQKVYTFAYGSPDRMADTVYFDLYALGGPSNVTRYYRLQQDVVSGSVNAVPGLHYQDFTDNKTTSGFVVEPGQIHTLAPIVVNRHPSLKTQEVILQFSIVTNEWFKPGETRKIWRRLKITDRLQQPAAWSAFASNTYWGLYSRVKHEFMIEQTGEKWDEEYMAGLNDNPGYALYWKGKLKELLAGYNAAHPDNFLKDENGVAVNFP